jgi:hypothetical protein
MFRNTSPRVNVSSALLRLHDCGANWSGAERKRTEMCSKKIGQMCATKNDAMVRG